MGCPLPGVELLGLFLQAIGLKGGEAPEGHVEHALCLLLAQPELLLQCFRSSSTCAAQPGRDQHDDLVGALTEETYADSDSRIAWRLLIRRIHTWL